MRVKRVKPDDAVAHCLDVFSARLAGDQGIRAVHSGSVGGSAGSGSLPSASQARYSW